MKSEWPAIKNQKLFKTFLAGFLHRFFRKLFQNQMQYNEDYNLMECYGMDSKVIKLIIRDILETGEYTLEGIAYHTNIPFDVIFDAACGNAFHLSITPWAKIAELYMQVKPDVAKLLLNQLSEWLEMQKKNHFFNIF